MQACCVSVVLCWDKQQEIKNFLDTLPDMSDLFFLYLGFSFFGEVIRGDHEKFCGGATHHQ